MHGPLGKGFPVAVALTLTAGCLIGIEDAEPPRKDAGGSGTAGSAGAGGGSGADAMADADATPGVDVAPKPDAAVDPTALLAHWKLDDGTGTVAKDATGNGHDLELTAPSWIDGKLAGALDFNGISTYGVVADPPAGELDFTPNEDFTITAWVRTTTQSPTSGDSLRIVSKQTSGGALYYLRQTSSGAAELVTRDESLVAFGCTGQTNIADGVWHHLAGTRSTTQIVFYVDGVAECTLVAAPLEVSNTSPLYLGAYTPLEQHFKGAIDDVRIYGRALSADEVALLAAE